MGELVGGSGRGGIHRAATCGPLTPGIGVGGGGRITANHSVAGDCEEAASYLRNFLPLRSTTAVSRSAVAGICYPIPIYDLVAMLVMFRVGSLGSWWPFGGAPVSSSSWLSGRRRFWCPG